MRRSLRFVVGSALAAGALVACAAPASAATPGGGESVPVTVQPRYEGDFFLWSDYGGPYPEWAGFELVDDVNASNNAGTVLTVAKATTVKGPYSVLPSGLASVRMSFPAPGTSGPFRTMDGQCLTAGRGYPIKVDSCLASTVTRDWALSADGHLVNVHEGDLTVSDAVTVPGLAYHRWYHTGEGLVLIADPYLSSQDPHYVYMPALTPVPADESFTVTTTLTDASDAVFSGRGAPGTTVQVQAPDTSRGQAFVGEVAVGADGRWSLSTKVDPGVESTYRVLQHGAGISDSAATVKVLLGETSLVPPAVAATGGGLALAAVATRFWRRRGRVARAV